MRSGPRTAVVVSWDPMSYSGPPHPRWPWQSRYLRSMPVRWSVWLPSRWMRLHAPPLEPKPVGRFADLDVSLDAAQQQLLEAFCDQLNAHGGAGDRPTVRYLDWHARRVGCCGAGDRYVYVDTNGDMHACPFCRAEGVGVLDHDIDTALALLQSAGCPAGTSDTHRVGRTPS